MEASSRMVSKALWALVVMGAAASAMANPWPDTRARDLLLKSMERSVCMLFFVLFFFWVSCSLTPFCVLWMRAQFHQKFSVAHIGIAQDQLMPDQALCFADGGFHRHGLHSRHGVFRHSAVNAL